MPQVLVAIDADPGSPTANSYITLADANAYFMGRLYTTAWIGATDDNKNRSLIWATQLLDTWFEWKGEATSSDQALAWPRIGVPKPNRLSWIGQGWPWSNVHAGIWEDSDTIPAGIEKATCEWAIALLTANIIQDNDVDAQGIHRVKAGPIEVEFNANVEAKPIPDAVMALASLYGSLRSGTGGTVTLLRA